MLLRLHYLFFLLTLILTKLNAAEHEDISKFEFIVSQILEPYQHGLNNFGEHVDTAVWNPIQYLLGDFLKENFEDQTFIKTSKFVKVKTDKILKQLGETTKIQEEEKSNNRMLQILEGDCMNEGILVDSSVGVFTCNGKRVNKTVYQANKSQDCTEHFYTKKLCYCPYDFYGYFCEYMNYPVCTIEPVSHPQSTCTGKDSKTYMYNYGQTDMPCHYSKRNSEVKISFKATCKHGEPQWNYEGIKIEDEEILTIPKPGNFTYLINTPNLKLSQNSSIPVQLRFINWKKVYKPLVFEENLTPDQITGEKSISFYVKLDSKFDEYRVGGRYHYELSMANPFKLENKAVGVIDDADFKEPMNTNFTGNSRFLVYFLLSLGIIVLTFFFLKYKNIILAGKESKKERYVPLIEMHEFETSSNDSSQQN